MGAPLRDAYAAYQEDDHKGEEGRKVSLGCFRHCVAPGSSFTAVAIRGPQLTTTVETAACRAKQPSESNRSALEGGPVSRASREARPSSAASRGRSRSSRCH